MNSPPPERQSSEPENSAADRVAEENVEKLLSRSYRPEEPDKTFVARTVERMLSFGRERSSRRPQLARIRSRWPRGWWAAAAALPIVGAVIVLSTRPRIERQGSSVWIEGEEFVRKEPEGPVRASEGKTGQREELGSSASEDSPAEFPRDGALVAGALPEAPETATLEIGGVVETGPKERRRVLLRDGSALYLKEKTLVRLEAERRVLVDRGEVFIEVTPRADVASGDVPFTARTATRTVTALGTKFGLRLDEAGTKVVVAQGKVRVDDASRGSKSGVLVHAGEYLSPGGLSGSSEAVPLSQRVSRELDWIRDLMAAARSPLVPKSSYSGGVLVCRDPYGQEVRLVLRRYHVGVHIEDGFARTTIDQTYFNTTYSRQEGTFYFPLPPDASLSRLAMYVAGNLMEGGMAEREYARTVYETIVFTRKDPALLEWVDGSTFKMRVFPIESRQEKRIILSYTQKLPTLYGKTTYRFPAADYPVEIEKWSQEIRVRQGDRVDWESPSHPFASSMEGEDLVLQTSAENSRATTDTVIHLVERGGGASRERPGLARFATAKHEDARYFMVRYRPDLSGQPKRERRHWVFLFESSAARDPLLARAQVEVIRSFLENLEHGDTFNVVTAGTRTRVFAEAPLPVVPSNVERAVEFLETTHLVGALNLETALRRAVELLSPSEAAARGSRCLVHVGSGLPTLGERREDVLAKQLPPEVKYVGVAVGKRWSRLFLEQAATRTGGYFTRIHPDENIGWRAFDLLATLDLPRLLDVKVTDADGIADFLVQNKLLTHGEELMAVARLDTGAGVPQTVVVTGTLDGEEFRRELPVNDLRENAGYLPRTWARLEIDRLLAENSESNKARIVALSKSMYVMSPYTSLLVLEDDAMYERFGVDRGRTDHWARYPAPERIEVVREAERAGNRERQQAARSPGEKPSVRKVLETVLVRIPPQVLGFPDDLRENQPTASTVWQWLEEGGYRSTGLGFGIVDGTANSWVRLNTRQPRDGLQIGGIIRNQGVTDGGAFRWFTDQRALTSAQRLATTESRFIDIQDNFLAEIGIESPLSALPASAETKAARSNVRAARSPTTLSSVLRVRPGAEFSRFLANRVSRGGEIGFVRGTDRWAGRVQNIIEGFTGTIPISAAPRYRLLGSALFRTLWRDPRSRLLYRRPRLREDHRIFNDLLHYAPGMNTTVADILGVLEAEARPDPGAAPGTIEDGARRLIAGARRGGWQRATIEDSARNTLFRVTFDGAGRHRYERTLETGLREIVISDGKTLWHLYPDLGLGARRTYSRFHRQAFAALVPWVPLPLEDLARGADVELVGERTVAVTPRRQASSDEDTGVRPGDRLRMELVFAPDGRLSERRVLRQPSGELVRRETYGPDGTMRLFDGDTVAKEFRITVEEADAPRLEPEEAIGTSEPKPTVGPKVIHVVQPGETLWRLAERYYGDARRWHEIAEANAPKGRDGHVQAGDRLIVPNAKYRATQRSSDALVILELPFRTRDHALGGKEPAAAGDSDGWSDAEALAVVASGLDQRRWEVWQIVTERFLGRGDRRIGFYTLLLATQTTWRVDSPRHTRTVLVRLDPVKDHPASPLARYVVEQLEAQRGGNQAGERAATGMVASDLLDNLTRLRRFAGRKPSDEKLPGGPLTREALRFIERCPDPAFTWAAVSWLQDHAITEVANGSLEKFLERFPDAPGLGFAARYERARALFREQKLEEARDAFASLYESALNEGVLPPLEDDFHRTFEAGSSESGGWSRLLRDAQARLMARRGSAVGIDVALQCSLLGETELAEELLATALSREEDRALETGLAAMEYFVHSDQLARAAREVASLLEDERDATLPELWRLAMILADRQKKLQRALHCHDRALDLEHARLSDEVDLRWVRSEFGQLLSRYQQVADALATLERKASLEFLAGVIRAADRWRALERDGTRPCQMAAKILRTVGAQELAWDYLTTPLAERSNEAAPWLNLARELRQQGSFDLASKAYGTAWETEPTNAQPLWEHAGLLRELGRNAQAVDLYRRLAEGPWQPRFQGFQAQAKRLLKGLEGWRRPSREL